MIRVFKQVKACDLVFCGAFALAVSVGTRIVFDDQRVFGNGYENVVAPICLGTILASILAFALSLGLLLLVRQNEALLVRSICASTLGKPRIWTMLVVACLFVLMWSPYILSLYPGAIVYDTVDSIRQVLGDLPMSNHHPVAFTALVGLFLQVPIPLGINGRLFIYAVLQSFMLALCLSYLITWLRERGIGLFSLVLAFVYFAFVPVFPVYAVSIQKDVPYSMLLLLFSLKLVDVCAKRNKSMPVQDIIWMCALAVLAAMMRNNG